MSKGNKARIKDKGGYLQMSFQWIFAIIVGAIILFMTIYGVTKYMNIEQQKQDLKSSREVGVLLNPTETSFTSEGYRLLKTNIKTKVYNDCNNVGEFGEQRLKVKQESFGEMSESGNSITSKNRYVFSDNIVESKEYFYLSTKPFNFPFKVSDLNYLTSREKTYCFQKPPKKIKESTLTNQSNIVVDCNEETLDSEKTIRVCFKNPSFPSSLSSNCDVKVYPNSGKIEKQNQEIYFINDALMYAGIFSSVENYECQLKRLMKRISKLSEIYIEKSNIVSSICSNNELKPGLIALRYFAKSYENSGDLHNIVSRVNRLENKNDKLWDCRLW